MNQKAWDYINAARCPITVVPQEFGLWHIERLRFTDDIRKRGQYVMRRKMLGFDDYTLLRRWTMATLHEGGGEIVMEDSLRELKTHLPIWMNAYGNVLITGLGLGCVVRGLLANPQVDHIDVIEIDPEIIRVIGAEFAGNFRVTIHYADALKFDYTQGQWDWAWHDLWNDGDKGDPHLQLMHAQLLTRLAAIISMDRQGAWAWPRGAKRQLARSSSVKFLGS